VVLDLAKPVMPPLSTQIKPNRVVPSAIIRLIDIQSL
jgi:hypothetical protein